MARKKIKPGHYKVPASSIEVARKCLLHWLQKMEENPREPGRSGNCLANGERPSRYLELLIIKFFAENLIWPGIAELLGRCNFKKNWKPLANFLANANAVAQFDEDRYRGSTIFDPNFLLHSDKGRSYGTISVNGIDIPVVLEESEGEEEAGRPLLESSPTGGEDDDAGIDPGDSLDLPLPFCLAGYLPLVKYIEGVHGYEEKEEEHIYPGAHQDLLLSLCQAEQEEEEDPRRYEEREEGGFNPDVFQDTSPSPCEVEHDEKKDPCRYEEEYIDVSRITPPSCQAEPIKMEVNEEDLHQEEKDPKPLQNVMEANMAKKTTKYQKKRKVKEEEVEYKPSSYQAKKARTERRQRPSRSQTCGQCDRMVERYREMGLCNRCVNRIRYGFYF